MKDRVSVYTTLKVVSQAYEQRKRHYLVRREAGEITRDEEYGLTQTLDYNLKYDLAKLITRIDNGELDINMGEFVPDAAPEDSENAEVANG